MGVVGFRHELVANVRERILTNSGGGLGSADLLHKRLVQGFTRFVEVMPQFVPQPRARDIQFDPRACRRYC